MNAGSDLDALVAEKVIGCRVIRPETGDRYPLCGCDKSPHDKPGTFRIESYSTDIAAAWKVADKVGLFFGRFSKDEYWAFLSVSNYLNGHVSKAKAAPLAICLAALEAVKA
jgi:hypothetical protein